MSSSVKSISISYDPINEQNTFSNGDVLTGWVVVVITKKTKIETLLVKVRGKAEVFWSESHGENTDYYHAKEKCLKLDQIILSRKKDENDIVLAPGNHVYQFAFQIPQGSLPSTFKGAHGSIQYKVEAKLSRSWRVPSRAKSPFTFQSKVDLCVQQLMSPQHETIRKKYNFLTSGIVNMNVNLDKSSYRQGDGLKVTVEVDNGTSREIAPKFCVTQKQNFYANGRRNLYMKKVVKAVGKPIPGKSQQMLVQVLDLPRDLSVSILNCKILKVEYKLRVYLNIPYAKDPELKIPFVVLPADYVFLPAAEPDLSVPFSTFGDTGKTNPPPAVPGAAYPTAPAFFPPQPLSGPFISSNPAGVPPPYAQAAVFPPQADPFAPPHYSAQNPHPSPGGAGVFPPQAVPGAPPPYIAFDQFPTSTAPGAPPPYWASGGTEPQPGQGPRQTASGLYPSLSESGEKVPL
ncbi:arrestin domain-containing protein 3-like isoform X1 [Scleropages formosus]|uniref:Arrestin domain-containing protein 3-like n=1 Tax=Scleropages formosus TaxID=113540 RepID=A0A8C9QYC3_SCLFO|nr:arrestin domain-containing protein 3-like isoform X1 [Scleropages formosus]